MPIPHVTPGQPWRPNAAKENAWTDAANDFADRRFANRPGTKDRLVETPVVLWAKNVSASNYDRFTVVGLSNPIFPDPTTPGFGNEVGFEVSSPATAYGPFGVLQEPILAPQTGTPTVYFSRRALLVTGVTPCKVEISDTAHLRATPIAGDPEKLKSSDDGPARILWKEAGEGVKWAIVAIEMTGSESEYSAGGYYDVEWVKFLEDSPSNGSLYRAVYWSIDNSGNLIQESAIGECWAYPVRKRPILLDTPYLARRTRSRKKVNGKFVFAADDECCTDGSGSGSDDDGSTSGSEDGSSSGSDDGSGSGSTTIVPITGYCTNSIPSVLTATVYSPCPGLNGITFSVEYNATTLQWEGQLECGGATANYALKGVLGGPGGGPWTSQMNGGTPLGTSGGGPQSCNPFLHHHGGAFVGSTELAGSTCLTGCGPGDENFSITVTE